MKKWLFVVVVLLVAVTAMGSTTWLKIESTAARNVCAVSASTLYRSGLTAGFQKSTDGGSTWSGFVGIPTATYNGIFFSDATVGFVGFNNYAGNAGGVMRTTNSGTSWSAVSISELTNGGVTDVGASGSLVVAVGTADLTLGAVTGTVHVSTNGGVSWVQKRSGVQQINTVYVSGVLVIAAGDNGFVTRSTDSGTTWTDATLSGVEKLKDVSLVGSNGCLVGFTPSPRKGRVYRTTDAGATWTMVHEESTLSLFNGIQLGTNSSTGVVVGQNASGYGVIWDLQDAGATLTLTYFNLVVGGALYGVSFSGDSPGWGVGQDGLVKTTGSLPIQLATFTATAMPTGVRLNWTTISEINNYGFDVQRKTGQNQFETLPNSFVSGNGTTNDPHYYTFTDRMVAPGHWSYRLEQIDLDGSVHFSDPVQVDVLTSVGPVEVPLVYGLDQNYPNPFNPTTTVRYQLAHQSHTSLIVYNLIGQEVRRLVDSEQLAGTYAVKFDGLGLTSGVYFYRLQAAGNFVETKKMMLVK